MAGIVVMDGVLHHFLLLGVSHAETCGLCLVEVSVILDHVVIIAGSGVYCGVLLIWLSAGVLGIPLLSAAGAVFSYVQLSVN
ncbi:MAG: hypothetical protein CSA79_03925 [Thiothrix nivea]|nr:MAG: hypothetical protein CSA79_03925 [Thiothrix nivea]